MCNMKEIDKALEVTQHMLRYREITDINGPSQQLLDFISQIDQISVSVGLESFDGLSVVERHELIIDKLQPEIIVGIALEGLLDIFKRADGKAKEARIKIKETASDLKIEKPIDAVSDNDDPSVMSITDFRAAATHADDYIKWYKDFVKDIPTTNSLSDWKHFESKKDEYIKNMQRTNDALKKLFDNEKVPLSKSGWTQSSLNSATRVLYSKMMILNTAYQSFEPYRKKLENLYKTDKTLDKQTAKAIGNTVYYGTSILTIALYWYNKIYKEIENVRV